MIIISGCIVIVMIIGCTHLIKILAIALLGILYCLELRAPLIISTSLSMIHMHITRFSIT